MLELVPALAARDPKDAYMFYDCQTDDVRLVLTDPRRGGALRRRDANGAEVTGCSTTAGPTASLTDADSGESIEVGADNVVNATGVWADRIRPEEIVDEEDVPRIAPSRGTHVTDPASRSSARPAPPASSPPARGGRSSPCPGTGAP